MEFLMTLQAQVLAVIAAVFFGIMGTAMLVHLSRSGKIPSAPDYTPEPRPCQVIPVISVEAHNRVERAAHVLADLLSEEYAVSYPGIKQRLLRVAQSSLPSSSLHAPGEVADGLVMLARAVPRVALYDHNVELLSKLRALTGAKDFLFVCGQLAAALRQPRYQELGRGLAEGDLSWLEFQLLLCSLPRGEVFLPVHKGSGKVGQETLRQNHPVEPTELHML